MLCNAGLEPTIAALFAMALPAVFHERKRGAGQSQAVYVSTPTDRLSVEELFRGTSAAGNCLVGVWQVNQEIGPLLCVAGCSWRQQLSVPQHVQASRQLEAAATAVCVAL